MRENEASIRRFIENRGKGNFCCISDLPTDIKITRIEYDMRYARYKVYVKSKEFTNMDPEELQLVFTVLPKTKEVVQFS
jgi:hypothetical protein